MHARLAELHKKAGPPLSPCRQQVQAGTVAVAHTHADVPAVDVAARHRLKSPLGSGGGRHRHNGQGGAAAGAGCDVGRAGGIARLGASKRLQGARQADTQVAGGMPCHSHMAGMWGTQPCALHSNTALHRGRQSCSQSAALSLGRRRRTRMLIGLPLMSASVAPPSGASIHHWRPVVSLRGHASTTFSLSQGLDER